MAVAQTAGSTLFRGALLCSVLIACGSPETGADGGKGDTDAGAGTTRDAGTPDAGSPDAGAVCGSGGAGLAVMPLTGCPEIGYGTNITIGSFQKFSMLLDTGSTTSIVASDKCTSCTGVSPLYTPGALAVDEGHMDTSTYGTGSVSGEVYQDAFQAVGVPKAVPLDFLAAESQTSFPLFEPDDCSGSSSSEFQGVLGLGPTDLALSDTQSYVNQVVSAGIEPGIFALQFCSASGNLWIGGFDPTCTAAAPQYTPLASSPYYAVKVSDMGIGGTSLGVSDYGDSVVDSGSNAFILPSDAFQALSTQVAASTGFKKAFPGQTASFFTNVTSADPCVQAATGVTPADVDQTLPPLTITFPGESGGSFTVSLTPTSSYLRVVSVASLTLFCPDAVPASDVGPAGLVPTILANPLIRSYVTIFDLKSSRIGFAPQQGCP